MLRKTRRDAAPGEHTASRRADNAEWSGRATDTLKPRFNSSRCLKPEAIFCLLGADTHRPQAMFTLNPTGSLSETLSVGCRGEPGGDRWGEGWVCKGFQG
jgi:hypothetical protein